MVRDQKKLVLSAFTLQALLQKGQCDRMVKLSFRWYRVVVMLVVILMGAGTLRLESVQKASASDCTVEAFSVSPNSSSQAVGTILSLYGRGNCGGGIRASRFNIDGGGFGEDAGAPEQSETWPLTAGTHTICFEIAGGSNGDWSAGARSCITITGTSNPPPPPSNTINPVLNGPYITATGNCQWEIRYTLSGFASNSTITVSSNYSETVCSTGQQVSSSWTVAQGSTDGNGNFTFVATHHGTGNYNYTFRDGQGNSRASSFTTSNSNPNPPANPPVNPPPSNPTTGGNNPTTGNTNPTNPSTGNSNPVVVQPSSPATPLVGSSTPPQGEWVRIVAASGMNIRRGPSTDYSVAARAANGVYLEYVGERSGWYEVRWNGGTGYVSGGSQFTQRGNNSTQNPSTNSPTSPSQPSSTSQSWCTHSAHAYDEGGGSYRDRNYYLQIPRGVWDGDPNHLRIKFAGIVVSGVGGYWPVKENSGVEDGNYWRFGISTAWAYGVSWVSRGVRIWELDALWSVEATC